MVDSVLDNVTKPYSFFESFAYDRVIAPAVVSMAGTLQGDIIESLPQGASVLDVGCGGGHLLELVAEQRPDLTLTGVDLSPDQVRRATRRLKRFGGRVRVRQGSALELPFDDNTFDGVYSMASIKHWPDQLQGLLECRRVLRSGGKLVVIEADRSCKLDDVKAFVNDWKVPKVLSLLPLVVFRTWVTGYSIDLEDARQLLGQLDLADGRAERIAGSPGLKIEGIKA